MAERGATTWREENSSRARDSLILFNVSDSPVCLLVYDPNYTVFQVSKCDRSAKMPEMDDKVMHLLRPPPPPPTPIDCTPPGQHRGHPGPDAHADDDADIGTYGKGW